MSDKNDKTVEIPLKTLENLTDYVEKHQELEKKVDEFKEGIISKEQYLGEAEELVKGMLEDHEKAHAHEAERNLSFATSAMTTDKAVMGLQKAFETKGTAKGAAMFEDAMAQLTKNEEVKALQEIANDLLIVDFILGNGSSKQQYFASGGMKSLKTFALYRTQLESVSKAIAPMDTTDTADFVPTALSSQILDLPWLIGPIEALFEHMPMPTSPYEVPFDATPVTTMASLIAEATTNTNNPGDTEGQNITDGKMTFTAGKLRSRMLTSAELDEDSVILWLPYIRKRLVDILANTAAAALLNGDTTGTHQDSDIHALGATDGRKIFKGLRKLMLAGSLIVDLGTGNLSEANLLKVKAKCIEFGVVPTEAAWIFGVQSYLSQVIKLDGCKKVNEYGPNATVISGELSNYYGSPVLVSAHQRENLNASGVYDDTTKTKGVCMYVNKNYWKVGDRRNVTLDAEKWITTDQINMVAFRRLDFQPCATPSVTYAFGAMGYNFSPTG